jgi:multidrug resistance efflux pump
LQKKIEKEEEAKAKLEQELGNIQRSVSLTQAEIQKNENLIKQAEEKINRGKEELALASKRIDLQKEVLKSLVQEFYLTQKKPFIFEILNEDDFSGIFFANHLLNRQPKQNSRQKKFEKPKNRQPQKLPQLGADSFFHSL